MKREPKLRDSDLNTLQHALDILDEDYPNETYCDRNGFAVERPTKKNRRIKKEIQRCRDRLDDIAIWRDKWKKR